MGIRLRKRRQRRTYPISNEHHGTSSVSQNRYERRRRQNCLLRGVGETANAKRPRASLLRVSGAQTLIQPSARICREPFATQYHTLGEAGCAVVPTREFGFVCPAGSVGHGSRNIRWCRRCGRSYGLPMRGRFTFEELVNEALAAPLKGWDFSWLRGRAAGSDPSWSYTALAGELLRNSASLLDIDTGGGEVLAALAPLPSRSVALEGWTPNLSVARQRLRPLGVEVLFAPDATLPLGTGSVDVVLNRHGRLESDEVARVLQPGGTLLTQQVGSDDCAAINEALEAPAAYRTPWNADVAVQGLTTAGLVITDVRQEWPDFYFYDIGALVFQLHAVPWQVHGFTVEHYEAALRRIDAHIRDEGYFRVRAHRFLIQARKV